jgi:DNA polymerase-3 subunit delta'
VRLSDVLHQERAISLIRRGLRSGRTHHAHLFEGPAGVGKERAALGLAARLLCEAPGLQPDADACGKCVSCRLLERDTHPDFHLVHRGLHKQHPDRTIRASKGLFLVMDVVRHFLIEHAMLAPSRGRARVFIVRDAERMNEDAQNALLKTLEEPPALTRLILVTSSAGRLLPTIRSRCQRVTFDLLPAEFVQQRLIVELKLAPATARMLAGLSGGSVGWALRAQRIGLVAALDQIAELLEQGAAARPEAFARALVEHAKALATRARTADAGGTADAAERDDAEDEPEDGEARGGSKTVETDELRDALKLCLGLIGALYRDGLVTRAGAAPLCSVTHRDTAVRLAEAAGRVGSLEEAIRAVALAEQMLDRNVNPQLVGERLALGLTGEAPAELAS